MQDEENKSIINDNRMPSLKHILELNTMAKSYSFKQIPYQICEVCYKQNNLVICKVCKCYYHLSCINKANIPKDFICNKCEEILSKSGSEKMKKITNNLFPKICIFDEENNQHPNNEINDNTNSIDGNVLNVTNVNSNGVLNVNNGASRNHVNFKLNKLSSLESKKAKKKIDKKDKEKKSDKNSVRSNTKSISANKAPTVNIINLNSLNNPIPNLNSNTTNTAINISTESTPIPEGNPLTIPNVSSTNINLPSTKSRATSRTNLGNKRKRSTKKPSNPSSTTNNASKETNPSSNFGNNLNAPSNSGVEVNNNINIKKSNSFYLSPPLKKRNSFYPNETVRKEKEKELIASYEHNDPYFKRRKIKIGTNHNVDMYEFTNKYENNINFNKEEYERNDLKLVYSSSKNPLPSKEIDNYIKTARLFWNYRNMFLENELCSDFFTECEQLMGKKKISEKLKQKINRLMNELKGLIKRGMSLNCHYDEMALKMLHICKYKTKIALLFLYKNLNPFIEEVEEGFKNDVAFFQGEIYSIINEGDIEIE